MYFTKFPRVQYDLKNDGSPGYQILTNIFFRVGILNHIKNNIYVYEDYKFRDGDRLDILAEKFYGSPTYHWIIALTNDMVDPLHDLPKDYATFNTYITNKYGSVSWAQTNTHHYEQRIVRKNNATNTTNTVTLEVDSNTYNSLAETTYTTHNLTSGGSCFETTTRHAISYYDHETTLNDRRRDLKIILPRYIPSILDEYENISRATKGLPIGYRTFA